MRTATILLFAVAASLAVSQEPAKYDLSRVAKIGESNKYQVQLAMDNSPKIEVSGTLTAKVLKASPNSRADVELSCTGFKALMDGQATSEFDAPPVATVKIGANALTEEMNVQGNQILASVYLISSYLPNKTLSVGDTFKVSWNSKSGKGFMEGDGKFDRVEEKDGKKFGVIKWKAQVQPDDVDGAADLSIESRFELGSGVLVSTKATGTTPGGDISFSVTPAK